MIKIPKINFFYKFIIKGIQEVRMFGDLSCIYINIVYLYKYIHIYLK